tara:strand:+ start:474 stop:599 length:126 start_codon:yes stop_codon:yes gene_type:complete
MKYFLDLVGTWIVNGMAILVGLWMLYVILMAVLNTIGVINV